MPLSSRVSSLSAATDIGTSCKLSDFLRAVTTTSSIVAFWAATKPPNTDAFINAKVDSEGNIAGINEGVRSFRILLLIN